MIFHAALNPMFGWINSYKALIIPYIAGGQTLGIVLARSYFQSMPEDAFESAKIEGAGERYVFLKIALPLLVPILITVGITSLINMYNDYIWPTLVVTGNDKVKTFCQIAFNSAAGNGGTNLGLLTASFVIGTISLVVITALCLKYYLQGMLEGAVKSCSVKKMSFWEVISRIKSCKYEIMLTQWN